MYMQEVQCLTQMVKNLPAVQETWARSLDQKDLPEKGMATTPVWRIPWTEDPGGLQSMGSQRVNMTERLTWLIPLCCTAETNTTL